MMLVVWKKNHFNNMYASKVIDQKETRYVHAVQSQKLFDHVARGAAGKGMKLNQEKTTLLCISASRSNQPVVIVSQPLISYYALPFPFPVYGYEYLA